MKSKTLHKLLVAKQATAVCEITGLTITMDIPAIPSKNLLTYKNPLAIPMNAIGIAKLSYKDHSTMPVEVLAGTVLSLMSHYSLIRDKLSAIQRNEILSHCSHYSLSSFLSLIASQSKDKIREYKEFSFEAITEFSQAQSAFSNYVELCQGKVQTQATYSVSYQKPKKEKVIRSVSPALRSRMKSSIDSLALSGMVNHKILQVLKTITMGDNLYDFSPSLKEKLIIKLEALEIPAAMEFVSILEESSIKETDIAQNFPKKSKTLAEIIAEKLGRPLPSEESPTVETIEVSIPIQSPESVFYPSFAHSDCDSCEYDMESCKSHIGHCYILEQESEQKAKDIRALITEAANELGYEVPPLNEDEEDSFEIEAEEEESYDQVEGIASDEELSEEDGDSDDDF